MTAKDPRYQTPAWGRLRLMVLDRDGWACQIRDKGCTHGATAVDHITPPLDGGSFWEPANLRASCKRCNSARGSRFGNARNARYRTTTAAYMSRF